MRRPRSWAPALAALALALVFLAPTNVVAAGTLSSSVVASAAAAPSPAPTLAQAVALVRAAPIASSEKTSALLLLEDLGVTGVRQLVSSLDPSEQSAVASEYSRLSTSLFGINGVQWGIIAGATLAGCGIGAILVPGIGCVIGGAAGLIASAIAVEVFHWGGVDAGKPNPSLFFDPIAAGLFNEYNLTTNSLSNSMQLFNVTEDYWYRLADSAATTQLGNATFQPELALAEGGVTAQIGSMLYAQLAQTDAIAQQQVNVLCANTVYSTVALASLEWENANDEGSSDYACPSTLVATAPSFYTAASGGGYPTLDGLQVTSTNVDVYTEGNSSVVFGTTISSCSGGSITFYGPLQSPGPARSNTTFATSSHGCGVYNTGFPAGGIYTVTAKATPGSGTGPMLYGFAPSPTSSTAGDYAYYGPQVSSSLGFGWSYSGSHQTYSYPTLHGPVWAAFLPDLITMETNAEANAAVYWSYLKALGCNGSPQEAQICTELPEPWMGIPDNLNLGSLTQGQIASMYDAYLNGLAQFFNSSDYRSHRTPPGAGTFTWGAADAYADGDVYIANTTEYPSENFSNPSTWALTRADMLLEPQILSVTIPLKTIWTIPRNDPITVFAQTNATCTNASAGGNASCPTVDSFEHLTGYGAAVKGTVLCGPNASSSSSCSNASGNDCLLDPTDPGCATTPSTECTTANEATLSCSDALYLSSCSQVNSAGACTVTLSTVNWTVANLTCAQGTSSNASCPNQNPTVPGALNFEDPFTAFASWLSNLLHIPGNVADALAAIIVVVVIVLILYAVYAAISNSRRRGGSRGSSGSS
jgi:hypothetical protein